MSADEAEEDGADDVEVEAGVLLVELLASACHRYVVEMVLAALEAGLGISTVDTYRPTHHSPFRF